MEKDIKYVGLWTPEYLAKELLFPNAKSIQHAEMRLKAWAHDIVEANKPNKIYVVIKPGKYENEFVFACSDKTQLIQKLADKVKPYLNDTCLQLTDAEICEMVQQSGEYKIIEMDFV